MAFEQPLQDVSFAAASTSLLQYRVVRLTSSNNVKHTTGASGVRAIGVTQGTVKATSAAIGVRVLGITLIEASSLAIKVGDYLRATSGAVASTSRLGGTVRPTTNNTQYVLGEALESAAAGTGKRLIAMLLTHAGRCSTA